MKYPKNYSFKPNVGKYSDKIAVLLVVRIGTGMWEEN